MADLENIELVMETRDLDEEEEWILLESKKILKEEDERKNKDLKQRSRVRWAKEGDENSKFFHSMINCRKACNVTHGLNLDGKRIFFRIFTSFFESGEINMGCGSSFIAVIPKVMDPLGLKDYMPISLTQKVLDSVISSSQSAFLRGRYILDGPLVVNEMGFPSRWCRWIKGVISSARASVLVNGATTFEFKCDKGMRKGDPISPFLFVIVMEALSCMIRKAISLGIVKGVVLPNDGPLVSHMFYADDAIIIGEWSSDNIQNLVRILKCFHACSGLLILANPVSSVLG
ncbi:uncharacterized protein LOC110883073 [Helianthus annuus]|uniref:uncharacterized protein LOC110883073 n=1 Tax=Helianthus annuus TaxID=4232 RepID=UPI000B9029BD|nr:uncharacterized protein LOC110883073 [Helianthus annuus]